MGMGGKQPPYICFENNGGLRTMGQVSIVLNNEQSTIERMPIVLDNRSKEQWLLIADNEQCFIVY
jgi:hypothetical protein